MAMPKDKDTGNTRATNAESEFLGTQSEGGELLIPNPPTNSADKTGPTGTNRDKRMTIRCMYLKYPDDSMYFFLKGNATPKYMKKM